MNPVFPMLLLLMLFADESRALTTKQVAGKKEIPPDLVNVFFADLCSDGCTEEEKQRWRENFHWELHDLDKDSAPEYLLYVDHPDWCGAGANCSRSIYQKTKRGYRKLAEGTRLRLLRNYTNGYRDLVSEHRVDASEKSGYWNYAFELYQFDGKKYQVRESKTIQKKG